LVRPDCIV